MASLHITKVAVGCSDLDALRERLADRAIGGESHLVTRYRPTRHGELIGGSLYWIVKHQLVARSEILRFEEDERGYCVIRIAAGLVPVRVRPKRAHQGWRYLAAADTPPDFDGQADELAEMPPALVSALAALQLV